jgi:hypothetical protein
VKAVVLRIAASLIACYVAWIGMLITPELGHLIGAWMTGGSVVKVWIPLLGFSQTIVHPNPREHIVVWCGPIVGVLMPASLLMIRRMAPTLIGFFVGFCLIANDAYIGIGWIRRAGDAGDLLRLGTPIWLMIAFGVCCAGAGLFCWHRTPGVSMRTPFYVRLYR